MGRSFNRAEQRRNNTNQIPEGDRRCPECNQLMSYNRDEQVLICPEHGPKKVWVKRTKLETQL